MALRRKSQKGACQSRFLLLLVTNVTFRSTFCVIVDDRRACFLALADTQMLLLCTMLAFKNFLIGKNNNTRIVQAESSKFASVSFDLGFQIWVSWN